MSLAPGSDVPDAVAPGAPLQMTLGATTDFLSTYTHIYIRTQMKEHKKLDSARVNAGLCLCEAYFSASSILLLYFSYNRKLTCESTRRLITQHCDSTVSEQTHTVRQDIEISDNIATTSHSHTPVFTHLLTKPSVLHVNRVCCCAEEVLTSSVLHLDSSA